MDTAGKTIVVVGATGLQGRPVTTRLLADGAVATGFDPGVPQQFMAVEDIGVLVGMAFADPGEWIGRAVDVAGDELTLAQITEAISEAIGRPVPYVQIPIEAIAEVSEQGALAAQWLNARGWRADIPLTRRLHPAVQDFRTWLATTGAARIAASLDTPAT